MCGAPLPAVPSQPVQLPPSYSEAYRAMQPPPPTPAVVPPVRSGAGSWGVLAAIAGVIVLVVAASFGAYFLMNGAATPNPSPLWTGRVVAPTAAPTPAPTSPPGVAALVATLNDPAFSVHMKVSTTYTANAKVTPENRSYVLRVLLDAQVSNGNESGTLSAAGLAMEFRLVDGAFYERVAGKWTAQVVPPATIPRPPLFDVHDATGLSYVGEETQAGNPVIHFRMTKAWRPDLYRIVLIDRFDAQPQAVNLDLWATPDGAPVRATFLGTTDAADGTRLLTIETSYEFSKPGVKVTITAPPVK